MISALACSDDDDDGGGASTGGTAGTGATGGSSGSGGAAGSGGSAGSSGSGGTAGSAGDGGTAMASLRVVHLSPDAPAVDVCVDGGAGFIGPVLKGAGDTDGLAYPNATAYVPLPAGTYDVRIVAPNADDCNTALGGLADVTGIALAGDQAYSAAAVGMLTPGGGDEAFQVILLEDVTAAATAGKAYLRFVHASPDAPAVDVGLGSGNAFTPVFTNVEFPNAAPAPGGGNYLETDPLDNVTVSARATGTTTDALVINGLSLPADAVATAFAIGNLDGDPQPLKVLVCVDSAAAPTCAVVP